MAVLKMQKLSICAMKKDRKKILEGLQALGVLEINTDMAVDEGFEKLDTSAEKSLLDKHVKMTDQALEYIDMYAHEDKSMFDSLKGKRLVSEKDVDEIIREKDDVYGIVKDIHAAYKNITEAKSTIHKKQVKKDNLLPWISLDIPLNTTGTKKTSVIFGTMQSQLDELTVRGYVEEANPDLSAYHIQIVSADKNQTCLVVIAIKQEADEVEDALRTHGFTRAQFYSRRTPADKIKKYEEEIAGLKKVIADNEEVIAKYADRKNDLQLLSDYYNVRMQKYEVLGSLVQSEKTFFITGYILEKNAQKTVELLNSNFRLYAEIEEVPDDEEPPVELKNNTFSASTEGVVESFGLPKKGEMDPTFIMSIFYVFLFGLMLSDAAYGFIIFITCFIVIKKFPRMSDSLKKSLRMFMYCGLSTLFWGVLFGGYFGDVVNVISKTFFGTEVEIPALWFAPITDPMKMLLYSMLFGVIHLFTGLFLKGYMMIRDGKYLDCLWDVGMWFAFLIGLIMMLIPSSIFESIAGQTFNVPGWFPTVANVLTIVGLLGILLMAGRRKKNPALRLALGAYDIYNITSWLSDVLSYSRLLALGLATGVIAQVVNSMASMGGKSVVGVIMFALVFLIGHVFNLAINLLGAYVHTNRLQYVEFFGKFYEGGGRKFAPFKKNTKYVDIEEDTKL